MSAYASRGIVHIVLASACMAGFAGAAFAQNAANRPDFSSSNTGWVSVGTDWEAVPGGPQPVAPFSHAVETDGFVFVTGQMPDTPQAPGVLPGAACTSERGGAYADDFPYSQIKVWQDRGFDRLRMEVPSHGPHGAVHGVEHVELS